MKRKFQVFLSSTYTDLRAERQAAVEAVLKAGHIPAGIELNRSSNKSQLETVQQWIGDSDLFCLILGGRYGTAELDNEYSYTEYEYRFALEHHIPVFTIILTDACLHEKAANGEAGVFEQDNIEKYRRFRELVGTHICREAGSRAQLEAAVVTALIKFEESPALRGRGWIRQTGLALPLQELSNNALQKQKRNTYYEIIRRSGGFRDTYDFYDFMDERFSEVLKEQTYIDKFDREVILTPLPDGHNAVVHTTTRIKFRHVSGGVSYYDSSPVFPSKAQADSYQTESFQLNGKELRNEIVTHRLYHPGIRQMPYRIKNDYPLLYESSVHLLHKTSFTCPILSFFQSYELIFPCRDFNVRFIVKNNENHKYKLKMATFSSFNVHASPGYVTGEVRNNDAPGSISISLWTLPGSGYAAALQLNDQ